MKPAKLSRGTGATLGALATLGLMGWLFLAHQWFQLPFVPLDITDFIIRLTPGAIATAGIEALGPWAQRTLMIFGLLISLGVGAGLGAWVVGRPRLMAQRWLRVIVLATALFLATLVVESVLGWNRAPVVASLPGLVASYLAWAGALSWGLQRLLELGSVPEEAAEAPSAERRAFLARFGLAALGLAMGGPLLSEWLRRPRTTATLRPLPTTAPTALPRIATSTSSAVPPVTATAVATGEAEALAQATAAPTVLPTNTPLPEFVPAPGTRPNLTPLAEFYVVDIATRDPVIDVAKWRLVIKGLVEKPLTLTYEELLAYPRVDVYGTLECISNEVGGNLIGTTQFNGLRLRDVLMQAGPLPDAVEVVMRSADGYHESIPIEKALHPDTLLVYGMDGLTLNRTHGYPLRLYMPDHFGMKNPKWLEELELVGDPYFGYWERRGWDKTARVQTTSVVDTRGALKGTGRVVSLGGIAYAGWRGIQKVEVRIDEGEWRPAQLDKPLSRFTWVRWRYDWHDPEPGEHIVTVRAVDGDGVLQTERRSRPHPAGATGWHTVRVVV